MRILDPFQMNDWGIRRYLMVVALLQVGLWGSLAWDALGIDLPLVRQLSGLLSVILLPGVGVLRVLRLHNLGRIESFLYSIAVSIATVMILGSIINIVYPALGMSEPFSSLSLMSTISILVIVLSTLDYLRNTDGPEFTSASLDLGDVVSHPTLVLLMILMTAIAGTVLMNHQKDNVLVLVSLIGVSGVFISIGFRRITQDKIVPLVIVCLSLTLLFLTSLIFNYVWGADIQLEHYSSNLVLATGRWDPTTYDSVNGMLSIAILAPTLSEMCKIDLTWVFKVIYPLIFSLVPLGLFRLYQRQIATRISALSVLFYISLWGFFAEPVAIARQEIALFFFVVLLLLLLDTNVARLERKVVMLIVTFSLIASHYGLSYLFLLSLSIVWFYLRIDSLHKPTDKRSIFSLRYVLFFFVLALTWYTYIASSRSFDQVLQVMGSIGASLFKEFMSKESAQGLAFIAHPSASLLHLLAKLMHIATQFLITVGLCAALSGKSRFKLRREFLAFASVSYAMMIAGIVIPFFASALNTTRLYQIGLVFLAPFCIMGGCVVFEAVSMVVRNRSEPQRRVHPVRFMSIFLAFFLLFNTGVVYELVGDHPASISLNPRVDAPGFSDQEKLASDWLFTKKDDSVMIADGYRWLLLMSYDPNAMTIPVNISDVPTNSYLFLGTLNIVRHQVLVVPEGVLFEMRYVPVGQLIDNRSKLFDNGGSTVYGRVYQV